MQAIRLTKNLTTGMGTLSPGAILVVEDAVAHKLEDHGWGVPTDVWVEDKVVENVFLEGETVERTEGDEAVAEDCGPCGDVQDGGC